MKSAVLRGGDNGEYAMYPPDCPSVRGRKHIRELIHLSKEGKRAMIFFVGALPGVRSSGLTGGGDPEIARLLLEARKAGVEIHALGLSLLPDGRVVLDRPSLEVELEAD